MMVEGEHSSLTKTPKELANPLEGKLQSLAVCLSHSWGGLEQVAANDALDLGRLGLGVKLLCLEGTPIHEYLVRRKEVEVIPLDFRPRNSFDFKLRHELYRLLDQGVNLIHTHQTTLLGSLAPWLWRHPMVPLIAMRHIMNSHNKKDFFHRMIYGRVDSLVVMSQALQRNVLATHPILAGDVKVINLGLDFDLFNPSHVDPSAQRLAWGVDSETRVIGMVGRIDPAKGQATFIKAAASLLTKLKEGEKIKFVIVGEETLGGTGDYLDELRGMVSQFGLENDVIFAGYQKNIPEVMRSFDVFVMPSRQEAFGLVAIEAMAMECPIVISSGGSADEIVGNQQFGLTVRPDDAFDLQRQLRALLDQPIERVEMGKRARDHVRNTYDRQVRIRKTLELYTQVLLKRKAITI